MNFTIKSWDAMEDIETYEVHHITNLLTKSPSQLIGYSSTNNLKFKIGSFECPPYAPLNLYVEMSKLRFAFKMMLSLNPFSDRPSLIGHERHRIRVSLFRSDQRGRFRKALEKFRERYFTSTLQSTMMRTSRTNGTVNNTFYDDPRLPRNGQEESMDMDMQDFQIKFDESTIDLNDDYRINVKLIPRVAWKKSLDSQ